MLYILTSRPCGCFMFRLMPHGLQPVSPRVEEKIRKDSQGSYCKTLSHLLPVLPAPVFFWVKKISWTITADTLPADHSCTGLGDRFEYMVIVCRMKKIFLRDAVSGAEGDGAEVSRLFPVRDFMNFDPFVLWDDFTVPASAGFPDHPHRGFEGITYVFEGSMLHKDNLGNESTVMPGGLQRFTAGKGIIHSEMPSTKKTTKGIQMWVNLPHRLKQVDPEYQQVDADSVTERVINGGSVRELVAEGSRLQLKTPVRYLDVQLSAGGGHYEETLPPDFRGFIYVVTGSVVANDKALSEGNAMFYDGDAKLSISSDTHSRFMVCFGRPHGEPIHQHGPYVD